METFHDDSQDLYIGGTKYSYGRAKIMGRQVHFWFHVHDGKVITDYVKACIPTPLQWLNIYQKFETNLARQSAKYALIIRDVLSKKIGERHDTGHC